ncbi:MAG: peptide/nickel transport system permease protein [Microvirga sp.]|jgi:dipeptide transport system permease protein|nr:peptide/nickel transport system permease protein [Microvirga sp.]
MIRLLARKAAIVLTTLLGAVLLAFSFVRLIPGDPIEVRYGDMDLTPEQLDAFRRDLGLDLSLPQQFLIYIQHLLRGDFGTSFTTNRPVWEEFITLLPATLELTICAVIFASIFGILLGITAAVFRNSWIDYGVMSVSVTGASMPVPWWGMMLILLVSVQLGLLPVSGRLSAAYYVESVTGFLTIDALLAKDHEAFRSALRHLVLPTIVLGTGILAVIARMTRSSMLEVLGEDYIRTAQSKGASRARILLVHALRNAMIPIVTIMGLQVGSLVAGAILTETVFSWPGIGRWLVGSVSTRDYPVLQGGVLLIGVMAMLVNLGVDVTYGLLDPRIRSRR